MTINVSRTPAPETWLSPHSLSSTTRKALDTRAIILEKSRFSVSTINSDLLPELLSWSAIMNVQSTSPRSQKVPLELEVPQGGDSDTVSESATSLSLSVILDPTTLEFGFDHSCFEGLDDLLVYSPMDAFSEFCWEDAIHEHDSDSASSPTPPPSKSTGRSQDVRSPLVHTPSSEEFDTDSDECLTFMEDDVTHSPIIGKDVKSVGDFSSYNNVKSLHYNDEATFTVFKQHFPVSSPTEAVGCFPVPVSPRRPSVSKRIATFCSQLPASLTVVRSPTSP